MFNNNPIGHEDLTINLLVADLVRQFNMWSADSTVFATYTGVRADISMYGNHRSLDVIALQYVVTQMGEGRSEHYASIADLPIVHKDPLANITITVEALPADSRQSSIVLDRVRVLNSLIGDLTDNDRWPNVYDTANSQIIYEHRDGYKRVLSARIEARARQVHSDDVTLPHEVLDGYQPQSTSYAPACVDYAAIKELTTLLAVYDWTHMFSDDSKEYSKGKEQKEAIIHLCAEIDECTRPAAVVELTSAIPKASKAAHSDELIFGRDFLAILEGGSDV